MTKADFDKLSFKKKAIAVFDKHRGFIASRDYYNQRHVLYDLGNFFAEVVYHIDSNDINTISSLSQNDKKINSYINSELR